MPYSDHEKQLEAMCKWRLMNRERQHALVLAWEKRNPHSNTNRQMKWAHAVPGRTASIAKKQYLQRKKNIPWVLLARSSVKEALRRRGFGKNTNTSRLLGCDWETFKKWIDSRFTEGMSWENRGAWHLDHITPISTALTQVECERLCHYTNLQPLWAADNIKKSNKVQYLPTPSLLG